MFGRALRNEERIGLAVAIAAHVALVGWLVFGQLAPRPITPPQRMQVTLSNDVALTSTAPDTRQARAAEAAQLSPTIAPPSQPAPLPPRPEQAAPPRPTPVVDKPAEKPKPAEHKAAASAPNKPQQKPAQRGGAERIGANFLKGIGAGKAESATGQDAAAIGSQVRASLASAVARQLKPHWQPPDGIDIDKLATTVEWSLNPDGSLAGQPQVVAQTGVNSANRAQAGRHREQAIRAIVLSAPFTLPKEYYAAWRKLRFTFDRNLSQ